MDKSSSIKAWGCPRCTPSSSAKIRSSFKTLYFYCLMHYAFFLERLYFCFQFPFALLAAINCWITSCLFFIAKNTIVFTLFVQRVFSFSRTAFSFRFLPWFLFGPCYIFASRCIWTTGLCWYSSKDLFQKGLNGVGKEKKFHAKSGTKRSLFRLWLRLFHAVLDIIFIVCLVVLP
jgi:hypothetical protein